jgi:hypothetical protein
MHAQVSIPKGFWLSPIAFLSPFLNGFLDCPALCCALKAKFTLCGFSNFFET